MELGRGPGRGWPAWNVLSTLGIAVVVLAACGTTGAPSSDRTGAGRPVLTAQGWTGPAEIPGSPALHVAAVSCTGPHRCVAVGSAYPDPGSAWPFPEYPAGLHPEVSTFDGSTWSAPVRLGTSRRARGAETLSCVGTTFCLATDGHGISYVFDGTRWRVAPMPGFTLPGDTPTLAETVACARPGFCVATLRDGRITEFHSGRWSEPRTVRDGFAAKVVGCLDRKRCAVGGAYGVLVSEGTTWTDSGLGNGFIFYSLTCSTRTRSCTAGGQDGFGGGSWTWSGKGWEVVHAPPTPPPHPGQATPPTLASARLATGSTRVSVGDAVTVRGTPCPHGDVGVVWFSGTGAPGVPVGRGGVAVAMAVGTAGAGGTWSATVTVPYIADGAATITGYCTRQVSGGVASSSDYVDFAYPPLPVTVSGTRG